MGQNSTDVDSFPGIKTLEGFDFGFAAGVPKGQILEMASLNFIEPMAEKPYSYNYEPPPGVPARNTREETHTVTVIDARPDGQDEEVQVRFVKYGMKLLAANYANLIVLE